MAPSTRSAILRSIIGKGNGELETQRLCAACAEITGMSGAGIMLMSGDVPRGEVCATDEVSHLIEELQYTLGEGPCVDAYNLDVPVLEPDLAHPGVSRWMAFTPPAVDAGVRAIFGFPLQIGAVRLGALDLYSDRPGALTDDQHANGLTVASIAAQAILVMQAGALGGTVAEQLEISADFQTVVHQASGMVSAQLEVGVAQGLIRLRAHAFGSGRPLPQVARAVVARELRFTPSGTEAVA